MSPGKRLAPGQARYIAKSFKAGRLTRWGVYDQSLGSWPVERPEFGRVAQDMRDEAAAQAEADRLSAIENGGSRPLSVA